MTSVLPQFRYNADRPIIARSALRQLGQSLNFSIVALAMSHLRSLRFGQTLPDADEHYGQTVDSRNEIDTEVDGNALESQLREEQGFEVVMKPLDLAARLKVIRDSCAAELEKHAGLRKNPLTGKMFKNPFDLVPPLEESVAWQLTTDVRIDDAVVKNTAAVVGLDEASIRLQLEKQHQTQQKFLKDNAAELYTIIDSLIVKGQDGHAFGIEDDESVEAMLPAINRARLFVAADRGLWNARNRMVGSYIRGNPEALTNIGLIDGEREMLHMKYAAFLKEPGIKDEIGEAVERGARYPTMLALFPKVKTPVITKVA